jgi:hypothetical protein
MKLYRVAYFNNDGSSHGFGYFSNKRDAEAAGDGYGDMLADRGDSAAYTVSQIEVASTKAGILSALNAYGAHADNG